MSPSPPIVHVVDDDWSFRTAVTRLLRTAGYEVCSYGSVSTFLSAGPARAPGCVLADLRMPGQGGLELQEALIEAANPIPVIFLTAHGDVPTTVRAMRGGAVDFLTKPVRKESLFVAVERALARNAAAREGDVQIGALRTRFQLLTPREREVLARVIAGKLNKQIAFDLGTSERTIKAHRANIVTKLGVRSVAELVRLAETLNFQPAR